MLGSQFPAVSDPYAQSRNSAYRPTFPPAMSQNSLSPPYAQSNAYSGMSTPSGYQAPVRRSAPQPYYPPVPSGFNAPNPETTFRSPPAGSSPSGGSVLDNFSSQNQPGLPAPARDVPGLPAPQAWQDPSPNLRWEYNTPPSGSPADQTVHRDVQQKWAYNPVKLASYVEGGEIPPVPAAASSSASNGPNTHHPTATFGTIEFGGSPTPVTAPVTSPAATPEAHRPSVRYNEQWN
jgi:hypothetical protein